MNSATNEKLLTRLVVLLICAFYVWMVWASPATSDSGDGIRHYAISKYSWKHPELFLDHWGKPVFTFISSPFSQLGMIGMNIFNIICFAITGLLCYSIAKRFSLSYPTAVVIFLAFAVVYIPTINSGLTEPLFGLMLTGTAYLFISRKYLWATLFVSLLPFVRSEGMMLLSVYALFLLLHKKYKYIPLLASGFVVLSLIGYFFVYHDILWLKHQNPYNGANNDIYGKGDLFHFFRNQGRIFGLPLTMLICAGLLAPVMFKLQKKDGGDIFVTEKILLIYSPFLMYFFSHVIVWWRPSLAGSLGLLRPMAAIIPLAAIIALIGLNYLQSILNNVFDKLNFKNKYLKWILPLVFCLWIIYKPFKVHDIPFQLGPEEVVLKETVNWLKENENYTKYRVYYLSPYLTVALDLDPFEPKEASELWGLYPNIETWGIDVVPDSSIVIWDAHFSPNECRIPLEKIMNDPYFDFVTNFKPAEEFTVLGGYSYEVNIFRKRKTPKTLTLLKEDFYDLDGMCDVENNRTIVNEKSFSGKKSCKLDEKEEYGVAFRSEKMTCDFFDKIERVDISFMLHAGKRPELATVVASITDASGNGLSWDGKTIVWGDSCSTTWCKQQFQFSINRNLCKDGNVLKVYLWNKGKEKLYTDDYKVKYFGN